MPFLQMQISIIVVDTFHLQQMVDTLEIYIDDNSQTTHSVQNI